MQLGRSGGSHDATGGGGAGARQTRFQFGQTSGGERTAQIRGFYSKPAGLALPHTGHLF